MIEFRHGNIFDAEVQAITNTVNCIGVMSKGLALQFKKRYPKMFLAYRAACDKGEVKVGRMWVWEEKNKIIVNFPTKNDWCNPSQPLWIIQGLADLHDVIIDKKIESIAIPALGCQNGGLTWDLVKPMLERFHATLPTNVKVVVYEPLVVQ
jgi:O-acetyl-ADP-ribose deacetylase (regulator of RNase III)